jgi:myo-inositol-1(or 4)-monophosphatase
MFSIAGSAAARQHAAMPSIPAATARLARRLRPGLLAVVATAAARIAAAQSRRRRRDVIAKGVGDFVTAVDVRVERWLRRQLLRLLPGAGFLGEETAPSDLEREFVWVVDPIDGTSNFAHGLPHFATAVGLLCRGTPVLAAVHGFPENATYGAIAGGGAFRNQRRLVTGRGRLDAGAIIGCQWFRGQPDLDFLRRLQRSGTRVRTFGCTVTQLLDVAAGRLDANVQQQGRLWDFAAAGLIAMEAGARFTDWRGRSLFPVRDWQIGHQATMAAPANVHRALLRLLA